jgi:hypothetical protein
MPMLDPMSLDLLITELSARSGDIQQMMDELLVQMAKASPAERLDPAFIKRFIELQRALAEIGRRLVLAKEQWRGRA